MDKVEFYKFLWLEKVVWSIKFGLVVNSTLQSIVGEKQWINLFYNKNHVLEGCNASSHCGVRA